MSKVRDGIIGVAIGDMIGVPVEFMRREALDENPVTGLREYGSHDQPLGSWSDDTSQTLALADALTKSFSLRTIAENFIAWWLGKKWTSHGYVFDIGQRTLLSFNDLRRILEVEDYDALELLHLEANPNTNGNGSLMRTLPLFFYLKDKGIEESFETIWQVSALTHPHIRAALACLVYLIMIDELIKQDSTKVAYEATQKRAKRFFDENNIDKEEVGHFDRLIESDISLLPREEIRSAGYVMDTLEASFWALLTTDSYETAILKAVNLGRDTDTVGSVTGGMAGIFYGIDTAPKEWYEAVAKKDEIEALCDGLNKQYNSEKSSSN